MRLALLFTLLVTPFRASACSCWGTTPIGVMFVAADAVVEGHVISHEPAVYSGDGQRPATVVVDVMRSLKGDVAGEIRLADEMMCYRSFSSEDFKPGRTFIFPLVKVDRDVLESVLGVVLLPLKVPDSVYSMYYLRGCAHSALELNGSGVYTNELVTGGGRTLEYYLSYPLLRALFVLGVFDIKRAVVEIGAVCLLLVVRARRSRSAVLAEGVALGAGPVLSTKSSVRGTVQVLLLGVGLQVLLLEAEPLYQQILNQPHPAWLDWLVTMWILIQILAPGVVMGFVLMRRPFVSGFVVAALSRLIVIAISIVKPASPGHISAFSLVGELVSLLALALATGLSAYTTFRWRRRSTMISNARP